MLAIALVGCIPAAAARAGEPTAAVLTGAQQWTVLAGYEEKAFRDYRWRMTSADVIDNGRQLREPSRSPTFTAQYRNCGLAAQTLSYMITGQYFSARRLAVSADWHTLSQEYARLRSACFVELNLDEREHPLPSWFGR